MDAVRSVEDRDRDARGARHDPHRVFVSGCEDLGVGSIALDVGGPSAIEEFTGKAIDGLSGGSDAERVRHALFIAPLLCSRKGES